MKSRSAGAQVRILLTGAAGQLGRHLAPRLARHGQLVTSGQVSGDFYCDLSEPGAVAELLDEVIPDVVVNAAGWTAVDLAEDEPEAASALNRDLPAELADWCASHERLLVHYSTDYVFSGDSRTPWREDDATHPQSVYGRTKLAGERAIAAAGCPAVVLRTAWLYSRLPGNFLSAIIGRAARGENLRVVSDQTGSPTWAGHLAQATASLLERRAELGPGMRVFHVTDAGAMTWYEFARLAVAEALEREIIHRSVDVEPITSDQWPQKAARPAWSVLDGSAFEQFIGKALPDTRSGLTACLEGWKR